MRPRYAIYSKKYLVKCAERIRRSASVLNVQGVPRSENRGVTRSQVRSVAAVMFLPTSRFVMLRSGWTRRITMGFPVVFLEREPGKKKPPELRNVRGRKSCRGPVKRVGATGCARRIAHSPIRATDPQSDFHPAAASKCASIRQSTNPGNASPCDPVTNGTLPRGGRANLGREPEYRV